MGPAPVDDSWLTTATGDFSVLPHSLEWACDMVGPVGHNKVCWGRWAIFSSLIKETSFPTHPFLSSWRRTHVWSPAATLWSTKAVLSHVLPPGSRTLLLLCLSGWLWFIIHLGSLPTRPCTYLVTMYCLLVSQPTYAWCRYVSSLFCFSLESIFFLMD